MKPAGFHDYSFKAKDVLRFQFDRGQPRDSITICINGSFFTLSKIVLPLLYVLYEMILYNYSPKRRWIVVYVYRDMKCRGIYLALFTNPEGDSYFSIYQIKFIVFLVFVCMTASFIAQFSSSENFSKRDAILASVANQWIACKDIPSYGSQPKRAKIAIHWFGKYKRVLFWKWLSLITNLAD